jgi:hypothetical protein
MRPRQLGLLGAASLLAACASNPGQMAAGSRLQTSRQAEIVLLLPKCPVSGQVAAEPQPVAGPAGPAPAAALPAAVVPVIAAIGADVAISALKDWLARLDTERSGSFMAGGTGTLPTASDPGRCLVVARGPIGPPAADPALPAGTLLGARSLKDAGLAAMPQFYFEARLRHAGAAPESKQELLLEPQVLIFQETIAKRARSSPKNIGMVLALRRDSLEAGSTAAALRDKAEAVFVLNLNQIGPGQEIAPQPFPAAGAPPGLGHPMLDLVRSARITAQPGQVNAYAVVTEQAEKAPLLGFLTGALSRNEKGAMEALAKIIADALKEKPE